MPALHTARIQCGSRKKLSRGEPPFSSSSSPRHASFLSKGSFHDIYEVFRKRGSKSRGHLYDGNGGRGGRMPASCNSPAATGFSRAGAVIGVAARHVSSREKEGEGRKSEGCTRVTRGGQETHCSAVFAIGQQMTNRSGGRVISSRTPPPPPWTMMEGSDERDGCLPRIILRFRSGRSIDQERELSKSVMIAIQLDKNRERR